LALHLPKRGNSAPLDVKSLSSKLLTIRQYHIVSNGSKTGALRGVRGNHAEESSLSEQPIKTEITGTVWQIKVAIGDKVSEEDPIMILESMKMEIPVLSPDAGVVTQILVGEGEAVTEGQTVAVLA